MDTIDQKGILQYAGAIVSTPGKDADCIKGLWQFGKILRTVNIRLRSFFLLLAALAFTASAHAENSAMQSAIIREIRKTGATYTLLLDFVEIRDCNCDSGIEIVNANPKLREYTIDRNTKIWLLKNPGELFKAAPQDMIAGRNGKNFGWPFEKDTPFEFHFAAGAKRILEMRQVYLP